MLRLFILIFSKFYQMPRIYSTKEGPAILSIIYGHFTEKKKSILIDWKVVILS